MYQIIAWMPLQVKELGAGSLSTYAIVNYSIIYHLDVLI